MSESMSGLYRILPPGEIDVLGERVFCDDELGLRWRRVEALPGEVLLARINARNETVLRSIAMLEEQDQTQSDAAERAELHRIEGKLNLVLELLTELMRERQAEPIRPHSMRLNARGLCWDDAGPVSQGALLEFEIFALPAWPVPLTLHGRVTSAEARRDGWRACARLEGLSTGSRDWLDKLVFRRHRRAVAHSRTTR
ncbi:MAG: PilZ domain-containing protein [Gammaproteobacteria bacterium]|nr:PilZ domain-containing protein [Gammaproteobacteria bacterium]